MRTGQYDKTIIIQRQSTDKDPVSGQRVDTWAKLSAVRGSIDSVGGGEFFARSGEHSEAEIMIRFWWKPILGDLSTRDRCLYVSPFEGNVYYDIQHVGNKRTLNRELILKCKVSTSGD